MDGESNGFTPPAFPRRKTSENHEMTNHQPKKGPRRFNSFAGRFSLEQSEMNDPQYVLDRCSGLSEDEIKDWLCKSRTELANVYKAVAVMNQLAVELDIVPALDNVRNVVLELLGCERVTLFLVDNQTKELRARVISPDQPVEIICIPFGMGIAGKVAETGISMNIPDVYQCELFNPKIDRKTGFLTKNMLCCAIADMSGDFVAVVQALNKVAGPFTALDEANLELFGVHLGNTLSKSRFYTAVMAEKQRLGQLYDAFRGVNTDCQSLDQLVHTVLGAVHNLVGAERSVLLFVDHARDQLWTRWYQGTLLEEVLNEESTCMSIRLGEGLLGKAAVNGEAVCLHDINVNSISEPLANLLHLSVAKTVLMQPIQDIRNGKTMAVVLAIDKNQTDQPMTLCTDTMYTSSDRAAMAVFAMEVATIFASRSLEVSFASALSTASPSKHTDSTPDIQNVLHAQLMSYISDDHQSISTSYRSTSLTHSLSDSPGSQSEHPVRSSNSPKSLLEEMRTSGRGIPRSPSMTTLVTQERSQLLNWDLDLTTSNTEELLKTVFDIFKDSGVVEHFKLDEMKLMSFIAAVCSHYRNNPYHNFCHVVYVLHCTYLIMVTTEAGEALTRTDQLVLLISSLCHDIDHDGHTNSFHTQTQSQLALCYNDLSPLENHHCALTFAILEKRDCNLLANLDKTLRQEIRRLMVGAILATDMACHVSLYNQFREHSGTYSIDRVEDRTLLIKIILHAADISNPARSFEVNCIMSHLVHLEFKNQVTLERELGIPVMPHMDIRDFKVQCETEVNFIDRIVYPLWEHLSMNFPSLGVCIEQIRANRDKFQDLKEKPTEVIAEAFQGVGAISAAYPGHRK